MSDDSKDKPSKKLKLSRDLKTQPAAEEAPKPPVMKLRRREELEPKSAPNPPETTSAPEPNSTETPSTAPSPSGETSQPSPPKLARPIAEEPQPTFDPAHPLDDIIKEGEIKKTSSPPPELPSKPAPHPDDGSGAKVEEAINSLNDDAKSKNSFLPSILVLLALLLVLVGAGYGLWKVLQTPDEASASANSGTASITKTSANAAPTGPIQKAKAAIEKVPVADVDQITGASLPTDGNEVLKEPVQQSQAQISPSTQPLAKTTASSTVTKASSKEIEATKQKVSEYLSSIHIGGVRKSDRPMILVDGQSYLVGDLLHRETGLKFDGIRKDRLAFRDSHGIVYLKSF